jgi:hypothetical protein
LKKRWGIKRSIEKPAVWASFVKCGISTKCSESPTELVLGALVSGRNEFRLIPKKFEPPEIPNWFELHKFNQTFEKAFWRKDENAIELW